MMAVRRFLDTISDSPTYVRDRANLISGFTVGLAGLLLNGAILFFIFPFLLNPDDMGFQQLTDHVEFGQLVGLVLLLGVTIFATILIPLRLANVFWEPRTNRYFDQIVLSGISPFRYVIGKATSQNLFLALLLFLLIPYLALSLALGGVNLWFFTSGLFLVWLYCISLALVTLWVSLYMNELLSALLVIGVAITLCICGCIPMNFQPFVMTPFPAFFNPIYQSAPETLGIVERHYWVVFVSCVVCMSTIIAVSCFGIGLGPLYGIIRENSMFGEVVRAGDTKRKRMMRIRQHIQRPSEIAFFYANRSQTFVRNEGFFRWGGSLLLLLLLSATGYALLTSSLIRWIRIHVAGTPFLFGPSIIGITLIIQATSLALAAILFSHSKNSTYMRISFLWGRRVEISRLDTIFFVLFLILSSVAATWYPLEIERHFMAPNSLSIYTDVFSHPPGIKVDYFRAMGEGIIVTALSGMVVYAFQRAVCLSTWMRASSVIIVGALYTLILGSVPFIAAGIILETTTSRRYPILVDLVPTILALSPFAVIGYLFEGQLGNPFPEKLSTFPFYVGHVVLLALTCLFIRYSGNKLRKQYLVFSAKENVDA